MIRRPPRSTHCISSAASDVYKRQYQRRVHGAEVKNNKLFQPHEGMTNEAEAALSEAGNLSYDASLQFFFLFFIFLGFSIRFSSFQFKSFFFAWISAIRSSINRH
eukprot:TRINITY_DN2158_c0_g1_i3.p5 TRINITY_DN2158_c0_g1~~TRINITY_DN2158_c0_g1_i3.p5  ORF type:complete len:105 (-),score=24.35 TRINITY_DN2158_c0_g1_i3:646-960(-)